MNQKGIVQLILLLLLLAGLIGGIILVQKSQIFRSKATSHIIDFLSQSGEALETENDLLKTSSLTVKVVLNPETDAEGTLTPTPTGDESTTTPTPTTQITPTPTPNTTTTPAPTLTPSPTPSLNLPFGYFVSQELTVRDAATTPSHGSISEPVTFPASFKFTFTHEDGDPTTKTFFVRFYYPNGEHSDHQRSILYQPLISLTPSPTQVPATPTPSEEAEEITSPTPTTTKLTPTESEEIPTITPYPTQIPTPTVNRFQYNPVDFYKPKPTTKPTTSQIIKSLEEKPTPTPLPTSFNIQNILNILFEPFSNFFRAR